MELILIPDSLTTGIVAFLFICSIMTSMVTASFGVGGGLLLLVLMAMWVPPAAIIPVHGIIQFASNGGRVVLTWRNINWKVLAAFIPGVVAGSLLGTLLLVQLPAYIWQLTIGLFVLYLCWGPGLPKAVLGSVGVFIAATATTFYPGGRDGSSARSESHCVWFCGLCLPGVAAVHGGYGNFRICRNLAGVARAPNYLQQTFSPLVQYRTDASVGAPALAGGFINVELIRASGSEGHRPNGYRVHRFPVVDGETSLRHRWHQAPGPAPVHDQPAWMS